VNTSVVVILSTAFATYLLRLGGLLLAEKMPDSPKFKTFMDALPACVLVSLVCPGIVAEGWWGFLATAGIIAVLRFSNNTFLAMVVGMLVISICRSFF